jgi:hypothetical protein
LIAPQLLPAATIEHPLKKQRHGSPLDSRYHGLMAKILIWPAIQKFIE